MFSGDVLTSCRYNNIYPIVNMKFVKDDRELVDRRRFEDVPEKYFYGLRLPEQKINLEETCEYIDNLLKFEKNYEYFVS